MKRGHSVKHAATACRPAVVLSDHVLTKAQAKQTLQRVLGDDFRQLQRLLRIVDNSGIEQRHLVRPLEETLRPEGFGARNQIFARESKRLVEAAAQAALAQAVVEAKDIDLIITTSCTGIMIPSVCAHLIPRLEFRPQTKRLPITELGCAAGVVALSRAREFIECYPGRNVLIVAHELCSLTYQPLDDSMQALVGAMLFGDGVAAVVVRGDGRVNGPGMRLDANGSFLFENSWDYMGFDIRDSGMHLILDKGIPGAVEHQIAPVLLEFLAEHALGRADIDFFCLHPGGRKVITEIARVFGLRHEQTRPSYDCLADVGNLSSASILVVLRNLFERYTPSHGARGLVTAFGPGFAAEMGLATWIAEG
jgi:1,3,6,8-tetrahydroxynaphthalene synthase